MQRIRIILDRNMHNTEIFSILASVFEAVWKIILHEKVGYWDIGVNNAL